MAESGGGNEHTEFVRLLREKAKERDPKYPDMTDRATYVIGLIQHDYPELTTWDITCFAASWLAMKSTEYVWLKKNALAAAVSVAQAHYFMEEHGLVSIVPVDYLDQTHGPRLVKDDESPQVKP